MIDKEAYQWRHQMENCVARIKEYRDGATHYGKIDSSDAANWNLVGPLFSPQGESFCSQTLARVRAHHQKRTVATSRMAEQKTWAQPS